jgi:hypothetical protein
MPDSQITEICGECDCSFGCYNGHARCIRLPEVVQARAARVLYA